MRVTYNGPLDAVDLPALTDVSVKMGETIEVSDELGARLIEQRCWDASPGEVAVWVGDDRERAATMLRAERDGAQRAEVLTQLGLVADPPPEPARKRNPRPALTKEAD